jgi:hypothetical protein
VAAVTVTVASQSPPSDGTGATFTATVEDDPDSPDFGKITSLTIADGGDDYLAWQWKNTVCCGDYYNGMSVVLKRLNYGSGNACRYSHRLCGVGNIRSNFGQVEVFYNGPTTPPTVDLISELATDGGIASSICNTSFTASGNVADCGDWSGISFSASGGRTATVSVGGTYDPLFRNPSGNGGRPCHVCCRGEEDVPVEIEMAVTGTTNGRDGSYVLAALPGFALAGAQVGWSYSFGFNDAVEVRIYSCGTQTAALSAEQIQILPPPVPAWTDVDFYGIGSCDHCWKKCMTAVIGSLGVNYEMGNGCGLCQDSPMCVPAGAYDLTEFGQVKSHVSFT